MGEARKRGTFEERKAQSIKNNSVKTRVLKKASRFFSLFTGIAAACSLR